MVESKLTQKKLIKLTDISAILISFLLILYSRNNSSAGAVGLLIIYLATRNFAKEFVNPYS